MPSRRWTEEEENDLLLLKSLTNNWRIIGAQLKRAHSSCTSKLTRMQAEGKGLHSVSYKEAAEKFPDVASATNSAVDSPEVDVVVEEIKRQKEKKEQKIDRDMLRRAALIDQVSDVIERACLAVPQIKFKPNSRKPKGSRQEQEIVALLSDLHLILAVVPEEVGGLGHYNEGIARKRLDHYRDSIIDITNLHRMAHPIRKLNLEILGDLVHGSNDAGQWGSLHTEADVVEQLFKACDMLTEFILQMRSEFDEVKVDCVYGNHGRTAKRGIEKKHVNWDYIIYKFLEVRLGQQKGITFNIPKAPFMVSEIMDYKFLLTHGDNIRAWMGLPFYGLDRNQKRMSSMLQKSKTPEGFFGETDVLNLSPEEAANRALFYAKPFDHMIIGHFHQPAFLPAASGGKMIINNSFVGGDDYTINDLSVSGTASQFMFGVHPDRPISFQYEIDLPMV